MEWALVARDPFLRGLLAVIPVHVLVVELVVAENLGKGINN
jgi:hypothetical protein